MRTTTPARRWRTPSRRSAPGARQIQGTLNGIGERCGNADLTSIIPTLLLKPAFAESFETGISAEQLTALTHVSHAFDEILNRAPNRQAPYVGSSAFSTKAGIHASAILKAAETYEHVKPEAVGNRRRVLVSDQAGRSNLISELERFGLAFDRADPRLDGLLSEIKERELQGYAYEGADASLELLARRRLGTLPDFFKVDGFRVNVERRFDAKGKLKTVAEAVVKVDVKGDKRMSVAEGNGPVNALDKALRKDLGELNRHINDLELVDYKVRILNGGTEAVTRVLIESRDGEGNRWLTVGVSSNIIDASFEALLDAVNYKLVKSVAGAGALGRRIALTSCRAAAAASSASAFGRDATARFSIGTMSSASLAIRHETSRSERMKSSRRIWSRSRISGSQKPAMLARSTGFSWRPSCAQVICSTSSSSVPTPPGRATNASARSNISILR